MTFIKEQHGYNWSSDKYDIEQDMQQIYYQYPIHSTFAKNAAYELSQHNSSTKTFKPQNIEEYIDNLDRPLIMKQGLADKKNRYMQPLIRLEKTIQHSYISQRALELNSNVRLLSVAGLKQVFSRLVTDFEQLNNPNKKPSAILLLSMLTAISVEQLITPSYIKHSKLFTFNKTNAYLEYSLHISKRQDEFDPKVFENELNVIRLPMPLKLIQFLTRENNLPDKQMILDYCRILLADLELPYLSITRIESSLHTLLHRYVRGSNLHIADLVCRIPAPHAPAIYYSSHNNQQLVEYYHEAVRLLNFDTQFNDSYFSMAKDKFNFTTGSGFALTLGYVRDFLSKLRTWVQQSDGKHEHFNRYSALVWIYFCLLTGTRPNNGLTRLDDIDLESAWFVVMDKPNKVVKNHRLIPLCQSLIKVLTEYKFYLNKYQMYANKHIEKQIHQIQTEQDEMCLLHVLSDNFDKLIQIKRGGISELLADFMPFTDSYWTRHFVRTQLEKMGISIILINSIIGHEQNRQELLGAYSSVSKQQIWQVRESFETIAQKLSIDTPHIAHNK